MLLPTTLPQTLTTPRCLLRTWRAPHDAGALRAALDASDAHLRPWVPFMRHEPRSLEDTEAAMQRFRIDEADRRAWRYAIWTPPQHPTTLLGECMLIQHDEDHTLEVGYWLHVDHQGKGFASEAVRAMCAMALTQPDVHALCMRCDVRNIASSALAKKLGASLTSHQQLPSATLGIWMLTEFTSS